MKQLIILALLVPMLSFANESEPMSVEEEVLSQGESSSEITEKLEQLQRVQAAVETVQANKAEESEPHWIGKVWVWGAIVFSALATTMSFVLLFGMGWRCIRFNYHYYVEYGDYRLGWALDSGERTKIHFILNKLGYKSTTDDISTDYMDTSWFGFLAMWLLGTAVMALGALLWPITLIVFGPNILTELVAHIPRKKKIFEKKLKGEMKNGSV